MARNRFELILSMFHISDNSAQVPGNRLHKVQPLIDLLVDKFHHFIIPEISLCIDESMVPFQGRLSFRQYLLNKRHRYGVKIFKLCTDPFYTLPYKVYAEKEAQPGKSVSSKVVMELMEPYLDFGRTLYADNWYNSVTLAEQLLDRDTFLVGTLRANRKRNPTDVTRKKLNKGDIVARQNDHGVMVLKWKDRRDVLAISSKHIPSMINVTQRRGDKIKPQVIVEYNAGKSFIDVSDQMNSYNSFSRRSLK
ncbi:piggyBac transposable element-derived protein 4-like [Anthonomus grandis grandis]|uniref:piggyBac transposable element-derived protein 4-like n=1 Tax=Anthonomus grandis grandis TaxID=2921223 RepID=UPI0021667050|nr:piggyBac transposable element-derived protein 4-like [Anthonomus grandis grandis]